MFKIHSYYDYFKNGPEKLFELKKEINEYRIQEEVNNYACNKGIFKKNIKTLTSIPNLSVNVPEGIQIENITFCIRI